MEKNKKMTAQRLHYILPLDLQTARAFITLSITRKRSFIPPDSGSR